MKLVLASVLLILSVPICYAGQGREITPLAMGWSFAKGDVPHAEQSTTPEQKWEHISVPHTWNVADGADGGTYYRGVGWYRRNISLSPEQLKKSLFIRFGAASLAATVYLNGKKLGDHQGGFTSFTFRIDPFVHVGNNTLAVRVTNARNIAYPPLSGDFTVYGGLYRPVTLIAQNKQHISLLDDSSSGVYIQSKESGDTAEVSVETVAQNDSHSSVNATVQTELIDPTGNLVATVRLRSPLPAAAPAPTRATIKFSHPILWDGVRNPQMYTLRTSIIIKGKVQDQQVDRFGIRSFRVDPNQGLILNGKPYDYHGVNLHQGRPSVGWAESTEMTTEDFRIAKEMGCTGVRLAHYPHSPESYEACDEMGLVAWAESPLVNQVTDSAEFRENAEQQLRELVKQNFNHPSILFWSMFNEPWIDKDRGDKEWRFVQGLVAKTKLLDPSRIVTGAINWGPNFWLSRAPEQTGFNFYWGWYGDKVEDFGKNIDDWRKQSLGAAFGISEYGAGASIVQHEFPVAQPKPYGPWHPEEWQAHFHETAWPVMAARPWLWCKLIWVMYDFASDGRDEGDRPGINDKGLVTADRQTKKDAYYFYQANWTTTPMVRIAGHNDQARPSGLTDIKAYTNCRSAELFLNGVSLGTQITSGHMCHWRAITLPKGRVYLKAVAASGHGQIMDQVTWTCP